MLRNIKRIRNTSGTVLSKTFFSLILLSLIPCLLIGCLSYVFVSDAVTNEVSKNNIAILNQIKESGDNIVSNLSSISYQVIFNSDVMSTAGYTDIDGASEFGYKNIMGFLTALKSTNEIISDIIIGFNNPKTIVSQDGKYDSGVYFSSIYKIDDIYKLNNEINNTTKLQFRYIGNYKVNYGGITSEKLMFLQSISYDTSNYKGYILIAVDKKELTKSLKQHFDEFNCYIIDGENEVFSINQYEINENIISIINNIPSNSIVNREIDSKRYGIIKMGSTAIDWKYAVVAPYENVIRPMIFIQWTTVFICVLVFLICLAASYIIGIRLHKPIKNLTDYIKLVYNNKLDDKNEYELMNSFFNSIFQENKYIKETLEESQGIIRQNAIKEILEGRLDKEEQNSVDFSFKNYQVIVFDIINAGDFKESFFKEVFSDIKKMTADYNNDNSVINAISRNGRYIVILIGENELETSVFDFVQSVKKYLTDNKIDFFAAIGRIYEGILNASSSYIDALYTLKHSNSEQVNSIIHYDEIEILKSAKPDITSEEQNYILNLLKSGDYSVIGNVIKAATMKNANKKHTKIYEQIVVHIEGNYCEDISLQEVSELTGVSVSYVSWIFKEISGRNFLDYLNDYRIKKVKELLISTDLTIEKIAEQTGFYSSNTLIRIFKKYESITPGQFRKQGIIT